MSRRKVALGLDFGTESVRALLLDLDEGCELAAGSAAYRSGVLDRGLPGGYVLPANWALQKPADWLDSLGLVVREVLTLARIDSGDVCGVGVDFTSCTVLPALADGTPLCQLNDWLDEPHAWPKLWKHHAAQPQADELNHLAAERNEPWLARYGGRVSSEWLIPKTMQIVDEAPAVFDAAERLVEGGDWVVWQLTGGLARNSCAAGFKALWQKRSGNPNPEFLSALRPELEDLFTSRAGGEVVSPGMTVGALREEWARRLGLSASAAVGAAVVDAHSGVLGAGITGPGTLYLATGTSTCHLLVAPWERNVTGISGVVEDGLLVGTYAYEAGQASVGDMFEWYSRLVGCSHAQLTAMAARIRPGAGGVLALDWWNGCRTPLVDADLSGVLVGLTLATTPEAIYRALLEASAFGTRLVVDTFADAGIELERLTVGGGLVANELILQIYADVTGLPVEVVGSAQPSARGAAVLGAAAAGVFASVAEAAAATAPEPAKRLEPQADAHRIYSELYSVYRELVAVYGSTGSVAKRLSALSRETRNEVARPHHVQRGVKTGVGTNR